MKITYNKNKNDLVVKEWKIENDEVLDAVSEIETENGIKSFLKKCLSIGSVAMKSAKLSERIDYIQKNFNNLSKTFDSRIDEYSKSLNKELEEYTKSVSKELEEKMKEFSAFIDGKDGVKVCFQSYFGEKGEVMEVLSKFLDSNLSLEKSDSPMKQIKDTFLKKVNELAKQLEGYTREMKKEEEMKEKTPLKGQDYEDQIEAQLNEMAKIFGDVVEAVGTESGVGKGKKGDFNVVVSNGLATPQIITFEAKAGAQSLGGKKSLLNILNESLGEREAKVAVGVVRNLENFPNKYQRQNGLYREYGTDKIVCVANTDNWFPLRVAYRVARARLFAAESAGKEVDAIAINSSLDDVITKLKQFTNIQRNLTAAERSIGDVKDQVKDLKDEIIEDLEQIQSELE